MFDYHSKMYMHVIVTAYIFDILLNCRITEMHLQNREILESYSELIKEQYTFGRRILHECLMNNVNRFSGFQLLKRKM